MQYTITKTELMKARKAGARFIRINDLRIEELTMWGRWTSHSRYADQALVEEGITDIQKVDPGLVLINDTKSTQT